MNRGQPREPNVRQNLRRPGLGLGEEGARVWLCPPLRCCVLFSWGTGPGVPCRSKGFGPLLWGCDWSRSHPDGQESEGLHAPMRTNAQRV